MHRDDVLEVVIMLIFFVLVFLVAYRWRNEIRDLWNDADRGSIIQEMW